PDRERKSEGPEVRAVRVGGRLGHEAHSRGGPAVKRKISPPLNEIERLRTPLTSGERLVLNVFHERLPDGWEVYVQPHMNGLRPDFVVVHPHVGIGVFEVKDWRAHDGL